MSLFLLRNAPKEEMTLLLIIELAHLIFTNMVALRQNRQESKGEGERRRERDRVSEYRLYM